MKGKLTPQQVADKLGYHVNHVYRLLASSDIRGEQFNRTWMIDESEVKRIERLRQEHGRFWKDHL